MLIKINNSDKVNNSNKNELILTDSDNIPSLSTYIYRTLILNNLRQSTINKELRNINIFQNFIENTHNINADKFIFNSNLELIFRCFQSFYMHLENNLTNNTEKKYEIWMTNVNYWKRISFLRMQNINENKLKKLKDHFEKTLELLSYLKIPKYKKIYKVKDIGQEVISCLDTQLIPNGNSNPFKNISAQWTYYIAYLILSLTGVRRGEILNLCLNDIRSDKYFNKKTKNYNEKFWINIIENNDIPDSRYSIPQLKNKGSVRQIPITEHLYALIKIYTEGYRPKSLSPFLLISTHKKALSAESLNKSFNKIYKSLPNNLMEKLKNINNLNSITPHNLRHTAATLNLKHLIKNNSKEDSFNILRLIYGWNEKSTMPILYAKNGYMEEYQNKINDFNSSRIKTIQEVMKNEKSKNC